MVDLAWWMFNQKTNLRKIDTPLSNLHADEGKVSTGLLTVATMRMKPGVYHRTGVVYRYVVETDTGVQQFRYDGGMVVIEPLALDLGMGRAILR